jgi:uncharacterized protein (TIGR02145 family)
MKFPIKLFVIIFHALILYLLTGCEEKTEVKIHEINFPRYTSYGTVKDQDSIIYRTVQIGEQRWMAENLRTTKYRNGDPIQNVTDNKQWKSLNQGAYCNYDNNSSYAKVYGHLYNWFAVNDSRNIAPAGWRVPSEEDWAILIDYLDYPERSADKLKETGTTHWEKMNDGATNYYGFSALPGGYRGNTVFGGADLGYNFCYNGLKGIWWSSTDTLSTCAFSREIDYMTNTVILRYCQKDNGFSIRCIKDN